MHNFECGSDPASTRLRLLFYGLWFVPLFMAPFYRAKFQTWQEQVNHKKMSHRVQSDPIQTRVHSSLAEAQSGGSDAQPTGSRRVSSADWPIVSQPQVRSELWETLIARMRVWRVAADIRVSRDLVPLVQVESCHVVQWIQMLSVLPWAFFCRNEQLTSKKTTADT